MKGEEKTRREVIEGKETERERKKKDREGKKKVFGKPNLEEGN